MLHHYTEFVEEKVVAEAEHSLCDLLAEYRALESGTFNGKSDLNDEMSPYVQLFPAF